MDKAHDIHKVTVSGCFLHIEVAGKSYKIDLARQSHRLARATQAQRQQIEVSPSGYGLHWPAVDEDLSVDGLIGARHTNPLIAAET
jgi:hypothetical protein